LHESEVELIHPRVEQAVFPTVEVAEGFDCVNCRPLTIAVAPPVAGELSKLV
jgi:hypothetical protein